MHGDDVNTSNIVCTAEEVEQAIKGLHIEKAGGHDCLTAKHLQNGGGRLPYMLAKLYNGCLSHGFVPDGFASLIIVPVPKGDGNKSDVFEGYRPVSLISIICKVFEICLLKYPKQFIIGDNLQFGFSTGKGCQKTLLMLSCVVDYFNGRGSDVYMAGLDLSKAFDSVNHYRLYIKKMEVGMPHCILNVIINWYTKLRARIKRGDVLSNGFSMRSGTMQGSVISPLFFILYINDLIKNLRLEDLGCYTGNDYCGCLLFADDILLLSASVHQLQNMLNICYSYCNDWDMKFNVKKSNVMVVGKNDNTILMPFMQLGREDLTWVKEIKYLVVVMHSKNGFRFDTNYNCRKFLCSSFSILQKCGRLSEPVLCEIILTKCLPILTYGLQCFNSLNS